MVFGEGSTTPRNDYPLQKINNEHVLLNILLKTPYPWLIIFDSNMTHVHLRRLNFQISFENQNTVDSKNSSNRLIIPICAKSIYLVLLEIEEKTINQISFFQIQNKSKNNCSNCNTWSLFLGSFCNNKSDHYHMFSKTSTKYLR